MIGSMLLRFIDLSSVQQIMWANPKTRLEYKGTELRGSLRPFGDTPWRNPLALQQLVTFIRASILSARRTTEAASATRIAATSLCPVVSTTE